MTYNNTVDLMHGTLEENAICQNYIENVTSRHNICQKSLKIGKNGQFFGKIRIFVINHPVSMGNVGLKRLLDIDLRLCDYLG